MTTEVLVHTVVLAACLATAATWDVLHRRIPNRVNVATAGLGLCAALLTGSIAAIGLALVGAGLVFALLYVAFRRRWIGGGDVKLGAAIGAWLGPVGGLSALVVGVAASGILGLALLARGSSAFRAEVKSNLIMACYTGRVGDTTRRPDSAHAPLGAALAASTMLIYLLRGGVGA